MDNPEFYEIDPLDEQINRLRKRDTPCFSEGESNHLTAEQYREIARSKPFLRQSGTNLQSSCEDECAENTAVQESYSPDTTEKTHTRSFGMSAENARQILKDAPSKEYFSPTVAQLQETVLRVTGREITVNANRVEDKESRINSASVSLKNSEKVSAYQCASAIFSTNKLRFLDSPEVTSALYRFDGRIWTPMTLVWLRATVMTALTTEEKMLICGFATFLKNVREFLFGLAQVNYKEGKHFTDDDFSRVKNRAVFLNCVYDVATGECLPHSSDLPYERLLNVAYVPHDQPTPAYDQIVSFATDGDPDSMAMFDYAIGYLAIPNQTGKCLFYLGSEPDSGKSLLSDSIYKCFGDYAYKVDPENLAGRFSYANAGKARLYCCSDMRKSELSETVASQFKRNTGDRVIRIEAKYQSEEQVTVRFKMLLVSNFPLLIKSAQKDEAFYRRVIVLPFIQSVSPEQRDSTLEERLNNEMSAVFSKCVRRLREIIGVDGGIVFPESKLSSCIKESWHTIPDMVNEFLEQTVQVSVPAPNTKSEHLSATELYNRYESFLSEPVSFSEKKAVCSFDSFKKKVLDKYDFVRLERARPKGCKNPVSCFANLKYKKFSD